MKLGPVFSPEAMPQKQKTHEDQLKKIELGLGKPKLDSISLTRTEPEAENKENSLSREELKDVLDKTLEVVDLLNPRRHLEYEVIDEADIVQVQVVNTDDGSIVRKIPADDIVKLVEQIHSVLSKRLDVKA
ncbi:MAG: flagellar protein FlaG [Fretibacterium sp.]|nr:flagellar protein FlaG [Fretibacterium sp.]